MNVQPSYYVRVVRLRWRVVAAFAVAGAMLAGLLTFMSQRQEPEVQITYFVATHKVVLSEEAVNAGFIPNLLQTALQITGDKIPSAVGEALGEDPDDLSAMVRTVTDTEVNKIEISAASEDPDFAALVADRFAAELITHMGARELGVYESALEEAQLQITTATDQVGALESEIADLKVAQLTLSRELDDSLDAEAEAELEETELPDSVRDSLLVRSELVDVEDEVRRAETQLTSRMALLEDALATLDSLQREGPPAAVMTTLDIVEPFAISEGEYNDRIRQGTRAENNFTSRSVPATSTGGLALGKTVSNPLVRIVLGLIGGLMVGVGAVLVHLRFDPRLRTKADVEEAFDLPVLAEIPAFNKADRKLVELHAITRTRSSVTESYRMVRSALVFAKATIEAPFVMDATEPVDHSDTTRSVAADIAKAVTGSEMRVVMVTSPGPSEGKTTTTANLAVVLAEAGYEVLVVNCDYRLPKLHKFFGCPHEPRRTLETGVPGVTLVADVADPGDVNPTDVVEIQRTLITKARKHFDVILLDTAPMLATNDAAAILPVVDLVVLVAAEGKTDREAATETVDLLRRRRANLAGVVLTGATGFGRSRYYYKYRYGNYYDQAADAVAAVDLTQSSPEHQPQAMAHSGSQN